MDTAAAPVPTRTCPACQSPVLPDATTCGTCWTKLSGGAASGAALGDSSPLGLASRNRYPDLHRAGRMLRTYGRLLQALCILGIVASVGCFAWAAGAQTETDTSARVGLAFEFLGWSFVTLAVGILFLAIGQGCVALADLATSSCISAEATAKERRGA